MGDKRAELSYTSATSDTPLLGDTIGAHFDRTAAAFPLFFARLTTLNRAGFSSRSDSRSRSVP